MCGILGYYGSKVEEFYNSTSLDSIGHRGPDFQNLTKGINFYLGQTRLSILDVSSKGNQPMFSKDKKYVIIFNHLNVMREHSRELTTKTALLYP